MSYDIRYSDNTATEDRRACADILAWFGRDAKARSTYRMIARYAQDGFDDARGHPSAAVTMMLSMAGVRGYPVQAFWRRYARRETL
jgi:hypothetical protein